MSDWHLPSSFRFTGLHCGIKPSGRPDLALIVSDGPASAAGVFTQNRVCAAPVQVCRERVPAEDARGIVINSGNANACTGERGLHDARKITALAAAEIGCQPDEVLVCSTGVIGVHLPMDKIETGIRNAARQLGAGADDLDKAANGILTTDTRIKVSTRQLELKVAGTLRVPSAEPTAHGVCLPPGKKIAITGIAKGAAMIGPNMATMLAFVLSDAPVAAHDLSSIAKEAAETSFNSISVEGHTSTNDTLLLLANGKGEKLAGKALDAFKAAVAAVCTELAQAIVADAEGASHLVRIEVEGLRSNAEAKRIAKTVADSALVKTAIFGADPNWGRFVSAAGYAGVEFAEKDLSLWLGDILLYETGTPQPFDAAAASKYMKENRDLLLRFRFTLGEGQCTFWTSDLTYEYVRLNAEYTT